MRINGYETCNLLKFGRLVFPDVPERFIVPLLMPLAGDIIPWEIHTEKDVDIEAMINCVIKNFQDYMYTYNGSWNGATSYAERKSLLLVLLFGDRTGRSINQEYFNNRGITIRWAEPEKKFILDHEDVLSKVEAYYFNGIYVSPKQYKWCKENAPAEIKECSDEIIMTSMFDPWVSYGEHNTSLPREISMTPAQISDVYEMVSDYVSTYYSELHIYMNNNPIKDMLEWCKRNAPEAEKDLPDDELIELMGAAYERFKQDNTLSGNVIS